MSQPTESITEPTQMNDVTSTRMKHSTSLKHNSRDRFWIACAVAFIVVMVIELGFFNLGHWRTQSAEPVEIGTAQFGSGLEYQGNCEYKITDPDSATITVPVHQRGTTDAPVQVKSVKLVATPDGKNLLPSQRNHFSNAVISVNDAVSAHPDQTWIQSTSSDGGWGDPRNTLEYNTNPDTQYLLFGKKREAYQSTAVRVTFQNAKGYNIIFDHLEVNPHIPLKVNPFRLLVEVLIAAFFVVFRPSSRIWRSCAASTSVRQRICTIVYIVAWSALLILIAYATRRVYYGFNSSHAHWEDTEQYQRLADALIHGRTWLDLPVDPTLETMSNPYSADDRYGLIGTGSHQYFWDHAYYEGHYYSYFGVIPALLTFIPYQLLTGRWMPTWAAIGIFSALAIAFGTLLLRRLARDYFPSATLGSVWLAVIAFNIGTNLFVYAHSTSFYGVPMTCSIALVLMGLWFWQISKRSDGTVSVLWIALGSLCMVLNLGSRPQFMIACFLAFPMFWDQIAKRRTLFSRKGFAATIWAIVPFIVVTVPLLIYNHLRFGKYFDFGANYNLTSFDMTTRKSSFYILFSEVFNQLFQPTGTTAAFPFVTTVDTAISSPQEGSIGGFFAIYPLAIFALLFIALRKQLRVHKVWSMTVMMMVFTLIIVIFDCYKCGTSMRYYGDFGYLLMLAAALVIFACDVSFRADASGYYEIRGGALGMSASGQHVRANQTTAFHTLQITLVALVFLTIVINMFGMFANGRICNWKILCPDLYATVRSWFIGLTA